MKKFTRTKVVFASVIAGLSLAAVPSSAFAKAVPNDPGFCGVRHSGPTWAGRTVTYVVSNRCASTYSFAVFLPRLSRWAIGSNTDTACQTVQGGGEGTWWYTYADPNWSIRVC